MANVKTDTFFQMTTKYYRTIKLAIKVTYLLSDSSLLRNVANCFAHILTTRKSY